MNEPITQILKTERVTGSDTVVDNQPPDFESIEAQIRVEQLLAEFRYEINLAEIPPFNQQK